MLPANGTLGITPQLQFTELHFQRVVKQQPVEQICPHADRELQNLSSLDHSNDSRQYPQHSTLRAAWHRARRRRFRIKTAVTWTAQVWRKQAGLTFKTKDGAIHVGLLQQHASIVGQIACRK